MTAERERGHSDLAMAAKAWPFQEARRILERLGSDAREGGAGTGAVAPAKGYVLFETGYGPSGLPHIGTFGEVARTTMVRHAFATLSDIPTRLFAFSDDMDGLRKVPDNVPEASKEWLGELADQSADWTGVPLTQIRDPFGDCHSSYAEHNNAKLREFLDQFGFGYEFQSATECYTSGKFDEALLAVLQNYDAILDVAERTVREERRRNYGLFLPLIEDGYGNKRYYYVRPEETRPKDGTIVFRGPNGNLVEHPVTGGRCKLLWRADWAMRWVALDVDYEMSGKDLIDSVTLSSRIARVLGAQPPLNLTYELFLDENGEKISKSRGNGMTIDEWLTYGPTESLSQFMYGKPKTAKRLHFDVIPKSVDEYVVNAANYAAQDATARLENPAWHIHAGAVPAVRADLTFAVLLNLASACNSEDKAVLWGFIGRYAPDATPANNPLLDRLVGHAIAYYRDFVKPAKAYRAPSDRERAAMADLAAKLRALPAGAVSATIQTEVYAVGKEHGFENLRDWFGALYEVLFGQQQGPRFGSFAALYGVPATIALIERALAGEDLSAA